MKKLRLRLAKQFAQSHTSSSWQYPNFNQDGLAPKPIVLNKEALGEISLPRCLLICETPAVTLPEICLCFATLHVLWFILPPLCFLNTLPSLLVVSGPCVTSRLEHFIVSRSPSEPLHSVIATSTVPKRLLHQPASYIRTMWMGLL